MFYSYIKLALRHMRRDKFYAIVNIGGLAVGLAFCITVLLHIVFEYSFEDFHANKDRIYRVDGKYKSERNGKISERYYAGHLAPLGSAMVEEVPGVAATATFRRFNSVKINTNGQDYNAGGLIGANPDFLKIFNFPLLEGDGVMALTQRNTILITESARDKYFPNMDAMGQTITFKNMSTGNSALFNKKTPEFSGQIAGVLKDIPANTQLECEFIVPYASLKGLGYDMDDWESAKIGEFGKTNYTFLLLDEGADPDLVAGRISDVLTKHLGPEVAAQYTSGLRPLRDMHFASYYLQMWDGLPNNGHYDNMVYLGMMALVLLSISIFNFINLSTARYATRQREVGVRKVLGAGRKNLIMQFLGESIVYTALALLLGISLHELFGGSIDAIVHKDATVSLLQSPIFIVGILSLGIVVGVVAGIYPALYLSRLKPVTIFQERGGLRKSRLRKLLVVLQFATAIVFIVASIMTVRQTNHVRNYDYGFDRENVVVLTFEGEHAGTEVRVMKDEVVRIPGVLSATTSVGPPSRTAFFLWNFSKGTDEEKVQGKVYDVDEDYERTFGLRLVAGSHLGQSSTVPPEEAVLITEHTVKNLKLENPVGARIHGIGYQKEADFQVVGVIADFSGIHRSYGFENASLIRINPDNHITLSMKLDDEATPATLAAIKTAWDRTMPGRIYNQYFLDEAHFTTMTSFLAYSSMFTIIALVAVGIASLGILGLIAFSARQKTKEIGIRKVLGASVNGIIWLLSKEFAILLVIANIIAVPIAYWFANDTGSSHVTRISLGPGTFLLATLVTIIIALGSTIFQARKAATANPVEALRYE